MSDWWSADIKKITYQNKNIERKKEKEISTKFKRAWASKKAQKMRIFFIYFFENLVTLHLLHKFSVFFIHYADIYYDVKDVLLNFWQHLRFSYILHEIHSKSAETALTREKTVITSVETLY